MITINHYLAFFDHLHILSLAKITGTDRSPWFTHAPWQAEETKKRAALLAVSPICALIPDAVLTLVAVPCCWISVEKMVDFMVDFVGIHGGFYGKVMGCNWNAW